MKKKRFIFSDFFGIKFEMGHLPGIIFIICGPGPCPIGPPGPGPICGPLGPNPLWLNDWLGPCGPEWLGPGPLPGPNWFWKNCWCGGNCCCCLWPPGTWWVSYPWNKMFNWFLFANQSEMIAYLNGHIRHFHRSRGRHHDHRVHHGRPDQGQMNYTHLTFLNF